MRIENYLKDPLSQQADSSATRRPPVARLHAAILGGSPSSFNKLWGRFFEKNLIS